ncbi:MAG: tetratricopeptide repeat protein, partial [Candidatus Latescibacterota bacterium]
AGAATALDPFGVGRSAEGQDAFHRGNVEARLGHAEKAIEAYREAIRRSSGLAAARYHLGVVLLGEGREEEGIRELIAAMELDPKNPRIPLALGDHMERKGEAGQAETLYRRSLSVDPYFADAYAALGGLLAERRRAAEAEPFFRRALEIEPESPAALVGLGKLLGEAGRTGEAAAFLERGVRAAPDWRDAWFEWGGHLFRAGRPAEAAGAFEKAARLEPRDVPSRMNLALARRASGDVGGAIAALREVLSIEPENETARRRLEDLE